MTFLRMAFFPHATSSHFDELAALLPSASPSGRLLFAAGPVSGGWQVVQIWESKELLDVFNRDFLLPAIQTLDNTGQAWVPSDLIDLEPTQLSLTPLAGL